MTQAIDSSLRQPAADPALWPLDPAVTFLNHGSFGSCPVALLEFQRHLRDRLERQPVQFLVRDLEPLWDQARSALAAFVRATADDLVFVPNATTGVNTVLRSLTFGPGDEILVTNHEYNATRNAVEFAARRAGASVVVAELPFPFQREEDLLQPLLERVTPRTRLVLLDHVTSQTGLVLPLRRLVAEFRARGVETLVDGAHAPGMVPLNLAELGAAYYTGNCHKWLCAPKGAAFLWVRRDCQEQIRPLVISHGANSPRQDRSRFLLEFGWTGTGDPTAQLSVGEALRVMGGMLPGGWPAVMQRNRSLALAARESLCRSLGIAAPCPPEFIGALASVPLPPSAARSELRSPLYLDPLQDALLARHGIELPIIPWPAPPGRLLRVSAQLYNSLPQYERLAAALPALL